VFISWVHVFAEGTVKGQLTLRDSSGKIKLEADHCFVYIFGGGYVESGEGVQAELEQKKRIFTRRSVAVVQGASVDFPNRDSIYHNIFSPSEKLSPRMDLGHYKKSSKEYAFKKPGNYQIFCNIHPEMVANVLVLPNKAFARVEKDGSFMIKNVRDGDWFIGAWSPSAKTPAKAKVLVSNGEVTKVELELTDRLPNIPEHKNKDGESYEGDGQYDDF
jgi:plastocyanin